MKRVTVRWTIALILAQTCVFAQESPPASLTESEVQSLSRLDQLSGWVGSRVDLPRGLCVLQAYTGHLPENGLDQLSEREENRLRQSWESCFALGAREQLRLVAELRASVKRTLERLEAPYTALGQCRKDKVMLESCLVAAVGRPLTGKERTTWGVSPGPSP